MDKMLLKGHTPRLVFPGCADQGQNQCPFANTVEAEFFRGYFTAARVFNPANHKDQADALANVAVGQTVGLFALPQETSLHAIMCKVYPTYPNFPKEGEFLNDIHAPTAGCRANTVAGVTFDVVGEYYDIDDGTGNCAPNGDTLTVPAALLGMDANVSGSKHAFFQEFVPEGQVLVLGIKLLSAPSTAGVSFADLAGGIALVSKVEDYQHPFSV